VGVQGPQTDTDRPHRRILADPLCQDTRKPLQVLPPYLQARCLGRHSVLARAILVVQGESRPCRVGSADRLQE
jgi:hypothetical protein